MRLIRRNMLVIMVGTLSVFTTGLIFLAGCGGSGGPIVPPETGPGPSPSAQFLALLPAAQVNATAVGSNTCGQAGCHQSYHTDWQGTVHATRNVGCESCHGNGSVHAAAPAKNNILTSPNPERPGGIVSPVVCGQCHGPTFEQFKNSRHSGIVADPVEGGSATCLRCHSATFRAKYVDNPMSKGETADQIDARILALSSDTRLEFAHETHESAVCATCHNPHKKTGILTQADSNEAQLRRLTFSTDTALIVPGAPVKNYTTYNHICGACHNGRGANGADGGLASTSRPNMHDSNQMNMLLGLANSGAEGLAPPIRQGSHSTTQDQCVHCHMPTRRHTFTVSFDTSCQPCHTPTDAAARATATRNEVLNELLYIRRRMQSWATTATVLKDAAGNRVNDPDFWDYSSLITLTEITGKATAGSASTITLPTGSSSVNDAFVPWQIEITAGTGSGQTRVVTAYNGTTRVVTVNTPWTTVPDSTSEFELRQTAPDQKYIPIEMRRARHNYYYVLRDGSFGIHNLLYARHLMNTAHSELDKLGISRAVSRAMPANVMQILQSDRLRAKAADAHANDAI